MSEIREQTIYTPSTDTEDSIEWYGNTGRITSEESIVSEERITSEERRRHGQQSRNSIVAADDEEAKSSVGEREERNGLLQQLAGLEVSMPYLDSAGSGEQPDDQHATFKLTTPITSSSLSHESPGVSPRGSPRASLSKRPSWSSIMFPNFQDFGIGNSRRSDELSDSAVPDVSSTGQATRYDARKEVNQANFHDVGTEEPPIGEFFDWELQGALRSGKELAGSIADQLNRCTLTYNPNSDLHKIWEAATEKRRFHCPVTRTVGIVGDSGSGKSSLINSLLHMPNLAHKGDYGTAVTSFVTEYRYCNPQYHIPFTIEVDGFTKEEIEEQLSELLYSYRALPVSKKEIEELAAPDYNRLEENSCVALKTLQSIFPSRPETRPEFLRDMSNDVYGALKALASSSLNWPEGTVDGKWVRTVADANECHKEVGIFMKNGLWPLIKVVRIYLKAQVLQSGVVLADLPGFRDLNLARVKKAEQYLLHCDDIFVVATIDRAIDNPSVQNLVRQYSGLSLGNSREVAVICTRADDIDVEGPPEVANSAEAKDAQAKHIAAFKARDAVETEIAKLRLKHIFMKVRSDKVQRDLMKIYKNVFCIGNRDYGGVDYLGDKARDLAARESGILDLRQFCHSIVRKARFRAVNHFLEVEMRSLIQMLEVWVAALDHVVPGIPLNCVSSLESNIEKNIRVYRRKLQTTLKAQVIEPLKASDHTFSEAAIGESQYWTTFHWARYKAFCNHEGDHHIDYNMPYNWNVEITKEIKIAFIYQWSVLQEELGDHMLDLQDLVLKNLLDLQADLQALNVPRPLLETFKTKEREIEELFHGQIVDLRKSMGTIRKNATEFHKSSYILGIMRPVYRACAGHNGKGTMIRMHNEMDSFMQRREIFCSIRDLIGSETRKSIDEMIDSIDRHVNKLCEEIGDQINVIRGDEAQELKSHGDDVEKEIVQTTARSSRKELDDLLRVTSRVRREIE